MFKKIFPISLVFACGLSFGAIGCGGESEAPLTGDPGDDDGLACSLCTGESVCVENRCEDAFPRFYQIEISSVTIPNTKPDGSCWDEPNCGAPDPEIDIQLNGEGVGDLDAGDDKFTASFTDAIELQIIAGSRLTIELQDDDALTDETVFTCEFSPLTAERIRDGDISCVSDRGRIEAIITTRGGANP